eukprot:TRINITY_DN3917_c0_g1_i1.p1 TRINITY_DN3917_c0_g1~~TRINITY_DN3917_c0_g1_i1.p1  ORF type:complete len:202 (+),score=42.70 TRINITY_DN3917_c0_g1_i1:72-677(+)
MSIPEQLNNIKIQYENEIRFYKNKIKNLQNSKLQDKKVNNNNSNETFDIIENIEEDQEVNENVIPNSVCGFYSNEHLLEIDLGNNFKGGKMFYKPSNFNDPSISSKSWIYISSDKIATSSGYILSEDSFFASIWEWGNIINCSRSCKSLIIVFEIIYRAGYQYNNKWYSKKEKKKFGKLYIPDAEYSQQHYKLQLKSTKKK